MEERERGVKNAVTRLQLKENRLLKEKELVLSQQPINKVKVGEINKELRYIGAKLHAINKEFDVWGLL